MFFAQDLIPLVINDLLTEDNAPRSDESGWIVASDFRPHFWACKLSVGGIQVFHQLWNSSTTKKDRLDLDSLYWILASAFISNYLDILQTFWHYRSIKLLWKKMSVERVLVLLRYHIHIYVVT